MALGPDAKPHSSDPPSDDDWQDAAGIQSSPDAWDEWDDLGILPFDDQPAEWSNDRFRRLRPHRPASPRVPPLAALGAILLVAAVVLAGVRAYAAAWQVSGRHTTPSLVATPHPAAPSVITLFAPDVISQIHRAGNLPLDTPLPSGAPSPPDGYLAPDKSSPYELSLIGAIGTPEKVIVVSKQSQTIHVYEDGAFITGSYAITGRPALPTPSGVWHIYYKLAPATLYSPWPPGSPYWYPPTPVNYAMEFKDGGFLIHDAPWHTVWGPGMNDWHYDPGAQEWQWGSHGCVNAPTPFVKWLYDWSPLGTTVILY